MAYNDDEDQDSVDGVPDTFVGDEDDVAQYDNGNNVPLSPAETGGSDHSSFGWYILEKDTQLQFVQMISGRMSQWVRLEIDQVISILFNFIPD